jgi:multiple sugar transport system substrate-binding protein
MLDVTVVRRGGQTVTDATGSGGWHGLRKQSGKGTKRRAGFAVAALVTAGTLACGGGDDSATPKLTWYVNPDNGGQDDLAKKCTEASNGAYRIETALLPNDASSQREQLVRRLAANDSGIDLMSLDPVFVAEFADAGFLRPFTAEEAPTFTDDVLDGPIETSTWDDQLVAAPFWANTQLLWYRKSVAQEAGIDPARQDVTWDQVIDAAEQTDTTVEVTGNRYEGYTVWINSLVASAGGEILADPEAGRDAKPQLDSEAGRKAAEVVGRLGRSDAADPQISTAIEENARSGFQADNGGFMVNWPYVYAAMKSGVEDGSFDQAAFDDVAWARVPGVIEGTPSAPPLGGINLGIGAFTKHPDEAVKAAECITSTESQTEYMISSGNPGAKSAVYDDPKVREAFPDGMADLIRDSINDSTPRPISPFYTDVSVSIQRTWHPSSSVQEDSTPKESDDLITAVLADEQLL